MSRVAPKGRPTIQIRVGDDWLVAFADTGSEVTILKEVIASHLSDCYQHPSLSQVLLAPLLNMWLNSSTPYIALTT